MTWTHVGFGKRGKGAEVSKQDQIDVLGDRLDELRDFVHGSDVGDFGLDDRLSAVHDQVVALRDEVASLRRRVKDLENMTGKQAKEPEPVTSVELAVWKERAEKAEAELDRLHRPEWGVRINPDFTVVTDSAGRVINKYEHTDAAEEN